MGADARHDRRNGAPGEGKTLTATLAASVAAMSGAPVHVVTVNDYLARRDAEEMGPIYRFLGSQRRLSSKLAIPCKTARSLRGRHRLRYEQRVRLRLFAGPHRRPQK